MTPRRALSTAQRPRRSIIAVIDRQNRTVRQSEDAPYAAKRAAAARTVIERLEEARSLTHEQASAADRLLRDFQASKRLPRVTANYGYVSPPDRDGHPPPIPDASSNIDAADRITYVHRTLITSQWRVVRDVVLFNHSPYAHAQSVGITPNTAMAWLRKGLDAVDDAYWSMRRDVMSQAAE